MLKKILKGLAGIVVTLIVLAIAIYLASGPEQPNAESPSIAWLQMGPHSVGQAEFTFVDVSRTTAENRGVPVKPTRTLVSTIWYPQNVDGSHPLIVHSHGILSNRAEMPYLVETLASYGYVVVAADYPLSSGNAEGGATPTDVDNQTGDISFLINSVLNLTASEKPFAGRIDANRIGLSGYSLGGLTTNVASYHVRYRDRRVKAAVSIAGLTAAFSEQFFATTNIPYLAIAGTSDALIEYRRHAADIPERINNASLITIDGGAHLGFLGAAEPAFRWMENPDTLGCAGVLAAIGENPNAAFALLGSVDEGIDMTRDLPGICEGDMLPAIHPGRQQMITRIAVLSFFESVFNPDRTRRDAAWRELTQHLPADFSEADYSGRY